MGAAGLGALNLSLDLFSARAFSEKSEILLPSSTVFFIERLKNQWRVEGDFRVPGRGRRRKTKDNVEGQGDLEEWHSKFVP